MHDYCWYKTLTFNKHLAYLADAYHQIFAQEDIWFGRCCLKNSKMAV